MRKNMHNTDSAQTLQTYFFLSLCTHHRKVRENTELREDFYETLDTIGSRTPKRDEIVLADDFNAKTGSGYKEFKDNMGILGKGQINSSGRRLLEACRKTDLIITNTLFQHKICHRTTWTAPFRNHLEWRRTKKSHQKSN